MGNGPDKSRFCFESSSWKSLFPANAIDNDTGSDTDSETNRMIVLRKIFRQKDPLFVNILNEMRMGKLSADSVDFLRKKCSGDVGRVLTIPDNSASCSTPGTPGCSASATTTSGGSSSATVTATRLFSVNRDVEGVNGRQLKELDTEQVGFTARDSGIDPFLNQLKQGLKVPQQLDLRVGAQVQRYIITHPYQYCISIAPQKVLLFALFPFSRR